MWSTRSRTPRPARPIVPSPSRRSPPSASTRRARRIRSLAYVDWNRDAQPTPEQAYEKLLPRIHPGAVVLLHSTSATNAEILDDLLTKWADMGYRFGTLDELFDAA